MKFYVNNYTVCLLLLYFCYHFYEQEVDLESRIHFFLIEDCYHNKKLFHCVEFMRWLSLRLGGSSFCFLLRDYNFLKFSSLLQIFHSLQDSTQRFRFTSLSFLPMSLSFVIFYYSIYLTYSCNGFDGILMVCDL